MSDQDRATLQRRRALELARARTVDDLSRASAAPHVRMLEQALAAIDAQLQQLGGK